MSHSDERKIFVGNLPRDVRTSEVEKLFYKFGNVRHVDVRGFSSGSPYAFLEFDHYKDARDAIRSRDGYNYDGFTLRVEYQRGPRRSRGRYPDDGYYEREKDRSSFRKSQPPQRTNYRAKVSGLPRSGSWQDVKDHVRTAGEVAYANVFNDGTGVIEFFREDDLHRAVREMDKTRFKSHEGETTIIRLKIQGEGSSSRSPSSGARDISRSRSISQSRSLSRSRSKSLSRSRSRSLSRSRSRSGSRSVSRSLSRSYSRSPDNTNVHVDAKAAPSDGKSNGAVKPIIESNNDSAIDVSKNEE